MSRQASQVSVRGPAILLVAVALVFLPMDYLPSFDVPKLAVLTLGACLLCLAAARRGGGPDRTLADPLLVIPLALTAFAAIGALVAWPRGSLFGPATSLACLAVANRVSRAEDAVRAVRVVARAAAAAAAAAGLYAVAQKTGLDFAPWASRRAVVATLGNPSFAAEFQAAALPFAVHLAIDRESRRGDRVLGAMGAVLAIVHLVLAVSRIDWFAAAAGLAATACLMLHARGRREVALALSVGTLVVGGAAGAMFFSASGGEGSSWLGRSDTLAVRTHVWGATARMIASNPLRAGGVPFVDSYPAWREAEEFAISGGRRVETPHDDYLEVGATLGVVGLLGAAAIVTMFVRRSAAAARDGGAAFAAVGGSLAALAVSALASSPLSRPASALLGAVCLGLLVARVPRPIRGVAPSSRVVELAFAAVLAVTFWPGPAFRAMRSDAFLALGRADVAHGDAEWAFRLLNSACAADPQAFDARYEFGNLLRIRGDPEAGITALTAARALRPGDPDCISALAYAFRDAGRRDDAARLVDEALATFSWHPRLLAARAALRLDAGDFAGAVAATEEARRVLPSDTRLALLAAEARLAADPDEAARSAAIDALLASARAGAVADAQGAARAFARRDPWLLAALVGRARRVVAERPEEAASLVRVAAPAGASDPDFLEECSRVLVRAACGDEAVRLLGRALGLRGAAAYADGQCERALKLAEQAAAREPIPEHFLLVARAAARLGETDAAVESLGAALTAGPVDAAQVRDDPAFREIRSDPRFGALLEEARRRAGENAGKSALR